MDAAQACGLLRVRHDGLPVAGRRQLRLARDAGRRLVQRPVAAARPAAAQPADASEAPPPPRGPLSTGAHGLAVGLGVGLGVGIPVLLLLAAVGLAAKGARASTPRAKKNADVIMSVNAAAAAWTTVREKV